MSNDTNGIFDMIHDEKTAKMDPEKWAAMNDPRPQLPSRTNDDRAMVSGMAVRRVEPRLSTPGAYRVGDTESYYGGRTVGDDSDDESEFMVVPRAALVDDEDKDGVMKDIEAPSSNKIPIVKAQRSYPGALHSATPNKKSSHKRKFRCCMILFCLLLAGLLGGVLYMLCKDDSAAISSLEAATRGGNGDGNRDRNNGGNRGDGENRGGDGGGGNNRGNNNNNNN